MTDRVDLIYSGGQFRLSVNTVSATSLLFPVGVTTRVMAVGDSLTQGQGAEGSGGYRLKLWNKMNAAGFDFLPVGPSDQPPYSNNGDPYYKSRWAGFGGWQIGDIAGTGQYNQTGKAIPQWIADHNPSVLLLMIGTNDLGNTAPATTDMAVLRQRFNALLDAIYTAKTDIDIVLAKLPHYQTYVWSVSTNYSNMIVEELTARVAQNPARQMAVADMSTIRESNDYNDYVHLNAKGYGKAADIWFDAITSVK